LRHISNHEWAAVRERYPRDVDIVKPYAGESAAAKKLEAGDPVFNQPLRFGKGFDDLLDRLKWLHSFAIAKGLLSNFRSTEERKQRMTELFCEAWAFELVSRLSPAVCFSAQSTNTDRARCLSLRDKKS